MGIDVEFSIRTAEPLGGGELVALEAAVHAEFCECYDKGVGEHRQPGNRYPSVRRGLDSPSDIDIGSLHRYYGTSYSRGHWPTIRALGDWLLARFGESAEVRYGGDVSSGFDELSSYPAQRPELERHWREHGHSPYRYACNCEHCETLPNASHHQAVADGD